MGRSWALSQVHTLGQGGQGGQGSLDTSHAPRLTPRADLPTFLCCPPFLRTFLSGFWKQPAPFPVEEWEVALISLREQLSYLILQENHLVG